jgi:predicted nucleotidyltransferase component of viral defense system
MPDIMQKKKRKPIDPRTARHLSDLGHMVFIEALTHSGPLHARQYAFHGGTSLHLSWKSPRFSEDLDFLLDNQSKEKLTQSIKKIETQMRRLLKAKDMDLDVRITDRTREGSNLLNYRVTVSSAKYIGNVHVKAEFWQVPPEYLRKYDTRFAYPLKGGDLVTSLSQPIPAATLDAAYADKMTACATRRHLKWRDVFDIWWLRQQIDIDLDTMSDKFLHHVTAFDTIDGLEPDQALRKFLEWPKEKFLAEADPDIKKWLPKELWNTLEHIGIEEIVDTVRSAVAEMADHVERKLRTGPDASMTSIDEECGDELYIEP